MIYITNAFSIQMLADDRELTFTRTSASGAQSLLDGQFAGAIGHADMAAIAADALGVDAALLHNRASVTLGIGDELIVAQYKGPRLPEGTTTLPEGATIEWWHVI